MYEVTVSSVEAVGLLRVVAAPRMTHTRRRGCGGHYEEDRWTENRQICTESLSVRRGVHVLRKMLHTPGAGVTKL